jgi:YtkA-like
MKTLNNTRALVAALMLAATGFAGTACAEIKDYAFQLVSETVPVGPNEIAVKLMNKKTGKAVPDAVIFASRLDMAPDGMAEMMTRLTPVSATEPGIYKFKANLSMAGRWQLSLGAKVQGETGTVEDKLVVKAGQ